MQKTTILFIFALLFNFGANATEIAAVVRDFDYPNIFHYKSHLIGKPKSNKFSFDHETFLKDQHPEVFIIVLKSEKHEIGNNISVEMKFKYKNSMEPQRRKINFKLESRTQRLRVKFDQDNVAKNGRVEFYKIKVSRNGEVISTYNGNGIPFPLARV